MEGRLLLTNCSNKICQNPADASEMLRIVSVGDYDDCACIGAHVGNTSEIGEFKILSHDFHDGVWRIRWKVIPR